MINLAYFFTALIIMIIVFIIDALSHQQENRKVSVLVHAIGLPVLLISMFVLAYLEFNFSLFIIPGAILIVAGLVIAYKGSVEIRKHFLRAKGVYKKGLYSKIRHPIYLGLIISFLGAALLVYSLLFLIYILASILMIIWFVIYEEKHLIKRFGKEYLNYKKQTGMLLPRK